MSTGDLADRPPLTGDDRAGLPEQQLAAALGAEFGLGLPEGRTRHRRLPGYAEWGLVAGALAAVFGLPVGIPFLFAPQFTATTRLATGAALAGVLVISWTLYGAGFARSVIDRRLFRYPGGLALLLDGEPEPRVARWADITTFTVYFTDPDSDGPGSLTGCDAETAGLELPGRELHWRGPELRALVAEASQMLSPRLGAALTAAYESGGAASFGPLRIDPEGVTLPDDGPVPWEHLESVTMTRIGSADGGHVCQLQIRRAGRRAATTVRLSGLPNAIFLPPLLARAATGHGVPVTGYPP